MAIDRVGAMYRRVGVLATWVPTDYSAGETQLVILDAPGEVLGAGDNVVTQFSMQYRTEHFAGIANGDEIVIDDTRYEFRYATPLDDGAEQVASLRKKGTDE